MAAPAAAGRSKVPCEPSASRRRLAGISVSFRPNRPRLALAPDLGCPGGTLRQSNRLLKIGDTTLDDTAGRVRRAPLALRQINSTPLRAAASHQDTRRSVAELEL